MGLVYSEPACQSAYDNDIKELHQLIKDDPKSLNIQDEGNGDTPLIAACRHGNLKVVQYLLDNHADATLRNKKQRTCLHYTAKRTFTFLDYLMIIILMPILLLGYLVMEEKQRKNVSLLKMLLSTNVDIDATDYMGNTGLHYLCRSRSTRLVPLLLERKADTSIKNKNGETALDIASRLKFEKVIRMLKTN